MRHSFARRDALILVLALTAIVAVTAGFRVGLHLTNPTTHAPAISSGIAARRLASARST
jgi:hypothetical protein